jgi:hypothetical protein
LVGVAVNVAEEPVHTGLSLVFIDTLTGRFGVTDIVIALDVAGLPEAQVVFEVSTQVTTLLFTGT